MGTTAFGIQAYSEMAIQRSHCPPMEDDSVGNEADREEDRGEVGAL